MAGYKFLCTVGQYEKMLRDLGISDDLIERIKINKMTLDQMRAFDKIIQTIEKIKGVTLPNVNN